MTEPHHNVRRGPRVSCLTFAVCGGVVVCAVAAFVVFAFGPVWLDTLAYDERLSLGSVFATLLIVAAAALPVVCFIVFLADVRVLGQRLARRRAGLCEACGYDYPRDAPMCPECGSTTPARGGVPGPRRSQYCPMCRYPRVVKPGEAEDERALCPECGARYV